MHIPDNYLSPSTCAVMGVIMLPIWARAVKRVKTDVSKKKIPLLGVCGAFSFLIMMFNVPIPGGTTAHAVGGTLIAILLGPYAATISVSIALLIQALFFGDGGILAFGANTFNMAFVMPFVGYTVFKFVKNRLKGDRGEYISAFIGGYVGIVAAAFIASIEFGIQPLLFKDAFGHAIYCPYGLNVSIPAMVLVHLLIGILEGAITAAVYAYVKKISPSMIYNNGQKVKESNRKPLYGILIALVVLCPLGLLASGDAWGEWDTEGIKSLVGYIPHAFQHGMDYHAIAADYSLSGTNDIVGYIISAIAGTAIIIIIFKIIGSLKKDNTNNT
ncbi:cobalt transporter CbiM [Clostridium sp. MT-14]|jgi:cobalt/nickel transport system permease protein|uniref:Cobalt transporter CbiM n=1 Tax=Clostridium aromativorans TaxID=2836848 RepID=A0ABS8NA04_9CLOT|nr:MULTISPECIES: cobalt transporter CbiM [Clostridium]KAA8670506.1 cobalt transporter CbiM [Clostridium sp. HV4-5-A1G]MCC9296638.1 cobalt transporter CbiM [Clostridium aromativorans]CAB1251176.1 putative fused nickel transport protein LarMN [Clostridiaceae bacterium BL-3]